MNGKIIVLKDEILNATFPTLCSSIDSFVINSYGEIAVLCSPTIYVYSANDGSYLISWVSPIENLTSIGFDGFGNFIFTSYSEIFIFNY